MSLRVHATGPILAAVLALALAGCNGASKSSQPATQGDGQVIAKVGTEDVTIHELRNEFRHIGVPADKVTDAITKSTLTDIVKRKALAQRAVAAGLDRQPTILLDIIRGREQILAGAVLQRDVQAKLGSIGKTDTDRFINAHPESFGQRVRFDVDQISITAPSLPQTFLDAVKDATSLDAIEARAKQDNLPYVRGSASLFSGDIPPELAERLRNPKPTDVFFLRSNNASTFVKVKSATPDPLSGEAAQQRATVGLRNEMAREEITGKDTDVQVTYFGTYQKLMEGGTTPPAKTPNAPAN